jgi:mono/diheme cytochrome c family protein
MSAIDAGMPAKIIVLVAALIALAAARPADMTAQFPSGVTQQMIGEGQSLYFGEGRCNGCHGETAKGVDGVGSDLTDGEWEHAEDGSYQALVDVISDGLTHAQTEGWAMPGEGELSEAEVKALAAYIWSLNRNNSQEARER